MNGSIWQRTMAIAKKTSVKRIALGLFVFLVLFGVVGYFALPGIIRSQAEKILTKELRRPVTIEKISVNPYWLAVSIHQFKLMEPDGKTVFTSFDRLSVSLSPESILQLKPVIRRIKLTNPYIHVSRNSAGKFNFDDFLARQPKNESPSPLSGRFGIRNILIEGGTFSFDDAYDKLPLHASLKQFNLRVKGLDINLNSREVDIDEITSSNAAYSVKTLKRRESVAREPGKEAAHTPMAGAKKSTKKEAPPFVVAIEKINLRNWAAKLEDHQLKTPVTTTISQISLDAKHLSSILSKQNTFDLKATVNAKGKFQAKGAFSISPLITDLKLSIKDIHIAGLQPYFTERLNFLVSSARLSSDAALQLRQEKTGAITGSVKGNIALDNVNAVDKATEKRLMRWQSLALNGIHAQMVPPSIAVDEIALNNYYARITVNETGRLNLQDLVRRDQAATTAQAIQEAEASPTVMSSAPVDPSATTAPTTAPSPAASHPSSKPRIQISKVTLERGRIRFTDNYIKPHYRATMKNFGGTITGLSSEGDTPATVNLHGSVNNAPLIINGQIDPLKGDLFLDLQAEVHGMELAPLSAYTSKYAGYGIEKGQISFEVAYKVNQRELTATNRLILNQLTFGEESENPDTEKLPVQLAVSLLRDSDGVIDIELPISGSLDDPEFSVGGVIGKAFVNMLGKAITSPFALLGAMFGGGSEELGLLEFEPGQFVIKETNEEKLTTLAEAMNNRPSLKLEITGFVDPATDKQGLAKSSLQRKLRAMKIKSLGDKGKNMQQSKVTLSPAEHATLVKQVYRSENLLNLSFLVGKQKALSVQEMEKALLEKTKVTNENLMALGTQRAVAAKEWLVTKGKVPPARVFVLSSKLANKESDKSEGKATFSRVEFAIKN